MRQLLRSRKPIALCSIAVVIAVAGGAYAATGGSGTITVCVKHAGGALYKADKCKPHDKSLTWNEKGDQGLQGLKGDTGGQGIQGLKGDTGDRGLQGLKGDTGEQGIQGLKGDTGGQGPPGFASIFITTATFPTPGGSFASGIASCPVSLPHVVGGGYDVSDSIGNLFDVMQNRPLGDGSGWLVRMRSAAQNPFTTEVWAICTS